MSIHSKKQSLTLALTPTTRIIFNGFLVLSSLSLSSLILSSSMKLDPTAEKKLNPQTDICTITASSVGLEDLVLPIEAGGHEFIAGDHLYNAKNSEHKGKDLCALDIWGVEGLPVVAVFDGEVIITKWEDKNNQNKGYGYYVYIKHTINKINYYSVYTHLKSPDKTPTECKVVPGISVKRGQCIGISGSTGYSVPKNFPHLHFAMHYSEDDSLPLSNKGKPLAPESMKGIKLYNRLSPQQEITTMATAEIENAFIPSFVLKQGETLEYPLIFTNTSHTPWTTKNKFELVMISGEASYSSTHIPLQEVVAPGESANFIIPLHGGKKLGPYKSEWQLHHNNVSFGPKGEIRYVIVVDPTNPIDPTAWLRELGEDIITNILTSISAAIRDLITQEINNLFYSICGVTPLVGFIGWLYSRKGLKKQRQGEDKKISSWKPKSSIFSLIGQIIVIGFLLGLISLILTGVIELVWWPNPAQTIAVVLIIISIIIGFFLVKKIFNFFRNIGWRSLVIFIFILILAITIWHGNRYHFDSPIPLRFAQSTPEVFYVIWYNIKLTIGQLFNSVSEIYYGFRAENIQ